MANELVQAGVTLAAVAFGAAGSFIATQGVERARWRRERSARWDERRLEAYAEYAAAVKLTVIRSRSILGHMGLGETLTPLSPEEGLPLLAAEESDRAAKLEDLMILANDETIAAARNWHRIAWKFQHWASGGLATTPSEVAAAYDEAQLAREGYYRAVRRELDVEIGREGYTG